MQRAYTFERDNTIEGFRSNRRVSTDALNAVIAVCGGRNGWHHDELTDPEDTRPRFRVTVPDEPSMREFGAGLANSVRENGVRVASDFLRRPGQVPDFVKDHGQNLAAPPIAGSLVTLRSDDRVSILVEDVEEFAARQFRGTILGFEGMVLMEHRGFRIGEVVEFLHEHVFAINEQ